MTRRHSPYILVVAIAIGFLIVGISGAALVREEPSSTAEGFSLRAVLRSRVPNSSGHVREEAKELQWQYSPPARWLHEIGIPGLIAPDKVTISDGHMLWQYYPPQNLYCSLRMDYKGAILMVPDGTNPAFIGPSPGSTIEDLMAQFESIGPSVEVRNVGRQEYLSTTVDVIEYSPAAAPNNGWGASVGRVWVDSEKHFILRHTIEETESMHRYFETSVTDIDFAPPTDANVFRFSPPAGATEFEPMDSNCDQGLPTSSNS